MALGTEGSGAFPRSLKTATTEVDIASATAPSSGQVLTATSSTAATWQTPGGQPGAWADFTGSRAADNTVYTNSASTDRHVAIYGTLSSGGSMTVTAGTQVIASQSFAAGGAYYQVFFTVPAGGTYKHNIAVAGTMDAWRERQ